MSSMANMEHAGQTQIPSSGTDRRLPSPGTLPCKEVLVAPKQGENALLLLVPSDQDISSTLPSMTKAASVRSETTQQFSPATPPMSDKGSPSVASSARPMPTRHPPSTMPYNDPNHHDIRPPTIQNKDIGIPSMRWEEVRKLREIIWGLRSTIHEVRVDLKIKGDAKAVADDLLFRQMVTKILGHEAKKEGLPAEGQKTLEELMKDCQEARDLHGPLEADCISLEDQLSREEFKLTELERPFFMQSEEPRSTTIATGEADADNQPRHSGPPSSVDEKFSEPEYHPLVSRYLSCLADLDLLHERRDELLDEQQALEDEKESRHRFGRVLDSDDQAWLDSSHSERDTLIKDIDHLEKEIDALKIECRSKGLIDNAGDPNSFQALAESSFHEEDGINPLGQTSEYVKYPILLPHPGLKKDTFQKYEPYPDPTSDFTTIRINEWMLKCLRMSPLAVNLLEGTSEVIRSKVGPGWEIAVLKAWFQDFTPSRRAHSSSQSSEADISSLSQSNTADENDPFQLHFGSQHPHYSHGLDATEIAILP
ncbi:hypothetical protein ACEPPN_017927 [Leptodophora sp. 'Broadleaf-Isolate-01']